MSNPTFSTGDLTREVAAKVDKFRLVKAVDGKVQHSDAETFPLGAVTEAAEPEARDENDVSHGLPRLVRVQTSQRVVKLTAGESDAFAVDAPVFAAADGAVAPAGTVKVGIAAEKSTGGLVRVHMFHPSIFVSSAGAAEGNA